MIEKADTRASVSRCAVVRSLSSLDKFVWLQLMDVAGLDEAILAQLEHGHVPGLHHCIAAVTLRKHGF